MLQAIKDKLSRRSSKGFTQTEKAPMPSIKMPFSEYLEEEDSAELYKDTGPTQVAEKPTPVVPPIGFPSKPDIVLQQEILNDMIRKAATPLQNAAKARVHEASFAIGEYPEPTPEPATIPAPAPVPPPQPEVNSAQALEELASALEKMNEVVLNKVQSLEDMVMKRSTEIRDGFKKAHMDAIEISIKLKEAVHQAQLKDLEIQEKSMDLLSREEDKIMERAAKAKTIMGSI